MIASFHGGSPKNTARRKRSPPSRPGNHVTSLEADDSCAAGRPRSRSLGVVGGSAVARPLLPSRLLKKAHLSASGGLARSRGAATYGLSTARTSHRTPPCIWTFLSSLGENGFFSILLGRSRGSSKRSAPARSPCRTPPVFRSLVDNLRPPHGFPLTGASARSHPAQTSGTGEGQGPSGAVRPRFRNPMEPNELTPGRTTFEETDR